VALSADANLLAVGGGPQGRPLRLLDLRPVRQGNRPRLRSAFGGVLRAIHALAFSPDNQTLASAGVDSGVILWDLSNEEPTRRAAQPEVLANNPIYVLAFSADSAAPRLAAGGWDRTIYLWSLTKGEVTALPSLTGHTTPISALAFSPDSQTLV